MTRQERSWILYDVANSAYSITITAAVFPIFFKSFASQGAEAFQSTAWLGYGNSLYTLFIALIAPLLGTIADFKNYKIRFFACFVGLGVLATALLSLIGQGEWLKALLIYFASAVGFAGANIFYDSFLVDVTTKERMDFLSTAGFAFGYIGGSTVPFIISIIVITNYRVFGFAAGDQAVKAAFIMTAIWWAAFTIPFLKNVKQRFFVEPSATPVRDSFSRLWQTLKEIRKHKRVFLFLIAYFFYIDGVDTIIKMATAFGTDIGIGSNTLLIILLAVQVVAFPFALLYGRLARITSTRFMLMVGIAVYILITILAFLLPALPSPRSRTLLFWVMSMLVATSQGGIQALSRSMYGKLVPPERSAEFFGFYNIFGKFAAVMGPFLMGSITLATKDSRYGVLSLISLFIVGGLLLSRVPGTRMKPENGAP